VRATPEVVRSNKEKKLEADLALCAGGNYECVLNMIAYKKWSVTTQ
jgi:hypothetical protein